LIHEEHEDVFVVRRNFSHPLALPFLILPALIFASCAPALIKLPAGPGTPATDGATALQDATKTCRTVTSMTAEIGASGSVAGHRLRARLLAGLAAPASVRLEAVAPFGAPFFVFVSRDNDATVLLQRDGRVLEHGRPDAVLRAVTGVPLNGGDLRIALSGCVSSPRADQATAAGNDWRIVPDGPGNVYLHRDSREGPWRLVAAVRESAGWRAEYRDFQQGGSTDGLPRSVRLTSTDAKRFDLRLSLSQVEINTALGSEVFTVQIPQNTEPITLEELERTGPLGGSSGP
jgi:hypothetical protein